MRIFCLLPKSYSLLEYKTYAGADPGILVGGGGRGFFSKARGPGVALRPPVGLGQSPGGGPGGEGPGSF